MAAAREKAATRKTPIGRKPAVGRGRREWRRRWSGSGADDRDPQPLGRVTARIARERGWSDQLAGGTVFGRWAEIVGAELADHAKPEALSGGELTVRAESTAWATQLRLLQGKLIAKIAAVVGPGVVKRIRIAGPTRPSWRYGPRHVRGRGPRDTYG